MITDAYGYYPGGDRPMSIQLPSGRTGVFITDPQLRGTVRAIVDADRNATNPEFKTYAVSPWGEVAADTGSITRLRMAGQPYDQDSRLYYMRARYYDPELGRFLSEDPIGIRGGLNLYLYAGNNPVDLLDPSGTSAAASGHHCLTSDLMMGSYDKGGVCRAVTIELPDIEVSNPGLGSFPITFVPSPLAPVISNTGPPGIADIEGLLTETSIANPIPEIFARVIPNIPTKTLGAPGEAEAWVTDATSVRGLNAEELSTGLGIRASPTGYRVIEFTSDGVTSIASPISRSDPGFVGFGRTSGGLPEYVIPNGPIPEGAVITDVPAVTEPVIEIPEIFIP